MDAMEVNNRTEGSQRVILTPRSIFPVIDKGNKGVIQVGEVFAVASGLLVWLA